MVLAQEADLDLVLKINLSWRGSVSLASGLSKWENDSLNIKSFNLGSKRYISLSARFFSLTCLYT